MAGVLYIAANGALQELGANLIPADNLTNIINDGSTAANRAWSASKLNGYGLITPDGSWTDATLVNSWVNYGAPYANASYRKDALGWVHIRGVIKSGTTTNPTTLFTLPAGYRPSNSYVMATDSNFAHALFTVGSNGLVQFNAGGNTYFALHTSFIGV